MSAIVDDYRSWCEMTCMCPLLMHCGQFRPSGVRADGRGRDAILTTHMDHVTYVCKTGQTRSILDWYGRCFGMERFLISSQETLEEDGIEIGDEVGMRMTVGEWISSWMCREDGVQFNGGNSFVGINDDSSTYDDRWGFWWWWWCQIMAPLQAFWARFHEKKNVAR